MISRSTSASRAYLELKMPGSGDDRLYLYLKTPGDTWYFFGYKQGILNVVSSKYTLYGEPGESKSQGINSEDMPDGEIYEIAPVNVGTANAFVARVKEGTGRVSDWWFCGLQLPNLIA